MKSKITSSDIYDINKKTGALILGSNRLDDYATKFLNKYCKEALTTPMPLPVEQILDDMGLVVKEVSLSNNLDIFGCCLLLDGSVDIYDYESKQGKSTEYKAGTILIDPESIAVYGEGSKRNTLIHEALHWEKDKTYFEILELKNRNASEKLYPILCRQSETLFNPTEGKKTKENEVKWLEWQAHRLAPRILMPKDSFNKKAHKLLKNENNNNLSCDTLISCLSEFFNVSRMSVKYRLLEVGFEEILYSFEDYAQVYESIKNNEAHKKLDILDAFKLLDSNKTFYQWVKSGNYIFAEGYFVLAKSEFVTLKDGTPKLTTKAKRNLNKCTINICEHNISKYQHYENDYQNFAYLARATEKAVTFHPRDQLFFQVLPDKISHSDIKRLDEYDMQEEIELAKLLGDPTKTLCNCLWFLMEKRKWNYPVLFNEKTELHVNYHGNIKNDKSNNMNTNTLMAICVGLQLTLRIVMKLFEKSINKLDEYKDPDMTYIHILESFPGISLREFNDMLELRNISTLETKSRK